MNVVAAFDPGIENTGYGIIGLALQGAGATRRYQVTHIDHGTIHTQGHVSLERRCLQVHLAVRELLWNANCVLAAVEEYFVTVNRQQAAGVYRAQGVILAACAEANVSCVMVNPSRVKMVVAREGKAKKDAVRREVMALLKLTDVGSEHAADALAIAVTALKDMQPERRRALVTAEKDRAIENMENL